jgi:hypothetical protein
MPQVFLAPGALALPHFLVGMADASSSVIPSEIALGVAPIHVGSATQ